MQWLGRKFTTLVDVASHQRARSVAVQRRLANPSSSTLSIGARHRGATVTRESDEETIDYEGVALVICGSHEVKSWVKGQMAQLAALSSASLCVLYCDRLLLHQDDNVVCP